ncbi:uncharacterized protein LOC110441797 [Mizuhopecten yessoensis]|uniref:uncharacterized protein LOC110441797 n=1 Tax=Mizuhopecten yessoensis TaxID=6573 RepID=UPI000B45CAD6|nr:uncharacterized protein LOC110441797 [Mizuhopecten yessoensis]
MELVRHFGVNRNTRAKHVSCFTSYVLITCVFLSSLRSTLVSSDCVQSDKVTANRIYQVSEITLNKLRQVCDVIHVDVKVYVLSENAEKNSNVTTLLFCPSTKVPEITVAFQRRVISLSLSEEDGSVTASRLPSNSVQFHVRPSTTSSTVLPHVYVQLKRVPGKLNIGRMYAQCGDTLESMEDYGLRLKVSVKVAKKKELSSKDRQAVISQRRTRQTSTMDKQNVTDQAMCGDTHSCFRYGKPSCQHMKCTYFVSYRVDDLINRRTIHLEISGKAQGWLAMGFSSDNKMGGADIIACVRKDVTSSEFRAAAFSTSYYHDTPTEKDSFSNLTRYEEADGYFYCYIQVPFKQRTGNYVDLSNDWYQLYAWGNVVTGGKIERHTHQPLTSLSKVSVMYKRNEYGAGEQIKGGNLLYLSLLILFVILV